MRAAAYLCLELRCIAGSALPRRLWTVSVNDERLPRLPSHDVPHVCMADSEH